VVRGLVWVALFGLVVSGCAGGGRADPQTEIPVACVAGFKSGLCAPGKGKYYYDYGNNRCRPTSGRGCGKRRLFDSLDACADYCGAGNR